MSLPQLTSDVSHKEILYFQRRAATIDNITGSTATFGANTNSFVDSSRTTRTYNLNDSDIPIIASSGDTLDLDNEGDNTAFNENFALHPRRGFRLNQIFLNFAIGFNVSAYTDGSPSLTSLTYQVFHWTAGAQIPLHGSVRSFTTGFTALSATGTQVYVVRDFMPLSGVMISENDQLAVNITTAGTAGGGTNTRQEGIVPIFPLSAATSLRDYSVSCAIFRGTAVNP